MSLLSINALYLDYLRPLVKWRIMNLQSLQKESLYPIKYENFRRVIIKFEGQGILKGFKDPRNKMKYLYLTSLGEKLINLDGNPISVSESTLSHDSKVSELVREFMKLECIDSGELEHELVDKRNFRNNPSHIPDGIISGKTSDGRIKIAIELELSGKSKRRMREKLEFYFDNSFYDYVFFIFPNRTFLNSYKRIMEEYPCGKAYLAYMPSIFFKKIEIDGGDFLYEGKELSIYDVLENCGVGCGVRAQGDLNNFKLNSS